MKGEKENTKEKGFAWSHRAEESQDPEMPISEMSIPEPAAHELFPGTFFSLSDQIWN